MKEIAKQIIDCFKSGGFLFVIGNGGSSAEAGHFVAELVGRYKHERKALPAISLTTDSAILTAIANDYGYEKVFTRQLEALSKKGDCLIALSTSGKSKNVLEAIKWSGTHGLKVFELKRIGTTTAEIQENHLFMLHKLAEKIEMAFL